MEAIRNFPLFNQHWFEWLLLLLMLVAAYFILLPRKRKPKMCTHDYEIIHYDFQERYAHSKCTRCGHEIYEDM